MTWLDLSIAADWVFLAAAVYGLCLSFFIMRAIFRIERHLRHLKYTYWHYQRHGTSDEQDVLSHYR